MYYKCRISQGVPLRLMHHTLLLSLKLMTVSTPPFFLPQGLKLGKKYLCCSAVSGMAVVVFPR